MKTLLTSINGEKVWKFEIMVSLNFKDSLVPRDELIRDVLTIVIEYKSICFSLNKREEAEGESFPSLFLPPTTDRALGAVLLVRAEALQAGDTTYSLQLHPVTGSAGGAGLQFRSQQRELLSVC